MPRTEPFDEHPAEYDLWFEKNALAYASELRALRSLLPGFGRALETGVGTGRFAGPLGITVGVEPSPVMANIARRRRIKVVRAVGEALPFASRAFDLVVMVTTVCFLDDLGKAFAEAHRVLAAGGHLLVGFLDRETELGRAMDERREQSEFYRCARFNSAREVRGEFSRTGFQELRAVQTVFAPPPDMRDLSPLEPGHGTGLFVVIRGTK